MDNKTIKQTETIKLEEAKREEQLKKFVESLIEQNKEVIEELSK